MAVLTKCLLPYEDLGSKCENMVAFATIATTNFESCGVKCCTHQPFSRCRCVLRFPSTNIKIVFQALVDAATTPQPLPSPPKRLKPMPPLRINIPEPQLSHIKTSHSHAPSPCPSPTGTIRYWDDILIFLSSNISSGGVTPVHSTCRKHGGIISKGCFHFNFQDVVELEKYT